MAFSVHYLLAMCLIFQIVSNLRLTDASKEIGFKRKVFENVATEIECCKCQEKIKVNPFDMLNYVHGAKTMRDNDAKPSNINSDSCGESDTIQIQTKLYLQRFINLLLVASGLKDFHLDSGHKIVSMEFDVSYQELKLIQDYAKSGDGALERIDLALSRILRQKNVKTVIEGNGFFADLDVVYVSQAIWGTLASLPSDYPLILIVLFVGTVFIVTVRHLEQNSVFYSMALMLFIIFTAGFGWNWLRMIKEEEAKIASTYALHLNQLPIHCRPHDMSWYQLIWYHSYEKDCEKYFKEISIDPSVRISPTLVLSETVSMMVLHPAGKIGTAFGEFLAALIDPIPLAHKWYLVPLVLILLFFTFFLTYVVLIGGVISLKTMLGSFEIGYPGRSGRTVLPSLERRQMIETVVPASGGGGEGGTVARRSEVSREGMEEGCDRGERREGSGREIRRDSGGEFGRRETPISGRRIGGGGGEGNPRRMIEEGRMGDEFVEGGCEENRQGGCECGGKRERRLVQVRTDSEGLEKNCGGGGGESCERRRVKVRGGCVRRDNGEEGCCSRGEGEGEEEEEEDFHSNFSPKAFKELKSFYKRFRTIVASDGRQEERESGGGGGSANISGVEELDRGGDNGGGEEERRKRTIKDD